MHRTFFLLSSPTFYVARIFLVIFAVLLLSGKSNAQEHEVERIRASFQDRMRRLSEMSLSFERLSEDLPNVDAAADAYFSRKGFDFQEPLKQASETGVFSFLDGRLIYEVKLTAATLAASKAANMGGASTTRVVFDGERTEINSLSYNNQHWYGHIDSNLEMPEDATIDVLFGLRFYGTSHQILPIDLQKAKITIRPDHLAEINYTCDLDESTTTLVDPMRDSLPLELWANTPNNHRYYSAKFTYAASKDIPTEISERYAYWDPNEIEHVRQVVTTKIISSVLPDSTLKPDGFHMLWPLGTGITDRRTHLRFTIASHDRTVSDKDIFEVMAKQKEIKAESLQRAQEEIDRATTSATTRSAPSTSKP